MSYERRQKRIGKGFLPSNKYQRDNEHNGLDLREDLNINIYDKLDVIHVFSLLNSVSIHAHNELPIAQKFIGHMSGPGQRRWSGMAYTFPDGHTCIVYNSSHSKNRIKITLMEEFFHIRLNHKPSGILFNSEIKRTYNNLIESEAYGSAAAALVPYKILKHMIEQGSTYEQISETLGVSCDLVKFRLKVTCLYKKYKKINFESMLKSNIKNNIQQLLIE